MKSDTQLLAELKEAAEGLLFMSESDYPLEIVYWKDIASVNPEYLREAAGEPDNAPIETKSIDDFFRVATSEAKWKAEQQLVSAKRYQALVKLLKENLEDIKVYKIGEINISVFIAGKAKSGNWIGLSTRVVET